jgi:enoyl-CoA hydratase/carnithine racemase
VGLARSVFDAWHALPQPLIAAVQTSAVGGGLALAPVCDFYTAVLMPSAVAACRSSPASP